MKKIRGVLVDLDGVLRIGGNATRQAAEALRRLSDAGVSFRIVTNTTTETKRELARSLVGIGFDHQLIEPAKIFTAPAAAVDLLQKDKIAAKLLVTPSLESEFEDCHIVSSPESDESLPRFALVVGDALNAFNRASLNDAFRSLVLARHMRIDTRVISLGGGNYYSEGSGNISLDAKPFAEMLAAAAEVPLVVCGKPEASTFRGGARSMDLDISDVAMIGDDWKVDIVGSLSAGCANAWLVQTGKYASEDEKRVEHEGAGREGSNFFLAEDFSGAVDSILRTVSLEDEGAESGVSGNE